jgi:hypothetical protein
MKVNRSLTLCVIFTAAQAVWAGGNVQSVTAEGGETWRHNFDISGLSRGTYNYIIDAHDHAGNKTITGPFNIKVDPQSGMPFVRVVYPENNSVVRQNINVLGVAAGRFGISGVRVRLDGGEDLEAEGTEYWSRVVGFGGVADGPHAMFFRATDKNGTAGPELRIDFILDTSPPKIELLSHRIGEVISGNTKIKWRTEDPNGIERVEISEDGENYKAPDALGSILKPLKKGEGPVEFEMPVRVKNGEGGAKTYYVRVKDRTGAITVRPYMFVIGGGGTYTPTAGSGIILHSPEEGEVITGNFEISGISFSGAGSIHWRFLGPSMESISKGPAGQEAANAARAYMANPNVPFSEAGGGGSFSIPVDFSMITDGEYVCEVYAESGGAQSEVVSRRIKVSTGAPETKIISPPITRYNSHVIVVRGYTGDANGVEKITVSMDVGLTWQEVAPDEKGGWEIPLNTAIYKDRVYSAFIIAEDKCGVTSFTNAMINIDNNAPELEITSPGSGEYVGTEMPIIGRLSDNIELKSLSFQVISIENPNNRVVVEAAVQHVIFETFSMERFTAGEYVLRVIARDLADNESVLSRKIFYDPNDIEARISIYNPLPGGEHTGPLYVAGRVRGTYKPDAVQLVLDGKVYKELELDRYGVFRCDIGEEEIASNGQHSIYAYYMTEKGKTVASANHTVYYKHYGPILLIDSHRDGDVITGRPFLRGRAMLAKPPRADGREYTRAQGSQYSVVGVEVSYDNGRTFKAAMGKGDWRWRVEPADLPPGTQPVVVRARFENGEQAVRRILLFIDSEPPQVEAVSPKEDSVHREELLVYGDAQDNFKLTDVNIRLRPFSKFWYLIPNPIKGLYIDVKTLGATYCDIGLGLSFFNNNVRFQGQYGAAPVEGERSFFVEGGRYVGDVFGIRLLANIGTIPFDWLLKNHDWEFYKMNFAVGANFSWFRMDGTRPPLYMGAVLAQIDAANVDLKYIYPNLEYFHVMSLYVQPELWFTSTDALTDGLGNKVPKTVLRISIGLRVNVF